MQERFGLFWNGEVGGDGGMEVGVRIMVDMNHHVTTTLIAVNHLHSKPLP